MHIVHKQLAYYMKKCITCNSIPLCGVVSYNRQITTGVEGLGFVCSYACSTCLSTSTIFVYHFVYLPLFVYLLVYLPLFVCLPLHVYSPYLFVAFCFFTTLLTSSCLFIFLFIYTHLFVYLFCLFTSAYCCLRTIGFMLSFTYVHMYIHIPI